MYERITLLRELLSDRGSIYLHCDYRVVHLLRAILEEIFDDENFQNEIQWFYSIGGKGSQRYARQHDTILFYSKSSSFTFNGKDPDVVVERKPNSHMRLKTDSEGRQFRSTFAKNNSCFF
nr:DNA methyltransferase [Thermosynechococcus sp. M98_K2018_005]